MYTIVEILLVGLSICGLLYMINMKNKYKNDTSSKKRRYYQIF